MRVVVAQPEVGTGPGGQLHPSEFHDKRESEPTEDHELASGTGYCDAGDHPLAYVDLAWWLPSVAAGGFPFGSCRVPRDRAAAGFPDKG